MRRRGASNIAQAFESIRSDYAAAKASRYRRTRQGLQLAGSNADYHYRSETDFFKVMEYARDMDRNDAIVGQVVNRAVDNTVQDGFRLDVNCGDQALDTEWGARFREWADNPEQCDIAGENDFAAMQFLTMRHVLVDGDIIALGTNEGALQMMEAHRLRTPKNTKKNVVNGVLVSPLGRREEYWLTISDVDPQARVEKVSDMVAYPARDANGLRQIFHVYNPKRVSQTRGVSAFAPVFDCLGMFEDINFAKLVQQQIVSCFAIFRKRGVDGMGIPSAYGAQEYETQGDGTTRTIEGIAPGMEIVGAPGEELTGFSPQVPNAEFFPHVKLILTLIGVNLGLPLVMVLMDASETNFSGFRGALEQARMGFRHNQKFCLVRRFLSPVYAWKTSQWLAEDATARALQARGTVDLYRHEWHAPTWPYIEPMKDAQADDLRLAKNLTSPRRLFAENGYEYQEIIRETVEDRAALITRSIERAQEINSQFDGAGVTWRDLAGPFAPAVVAPEIQQSTEVV